jgi:hypothetical protein
MARKLNRERNKADNSGKAHSTGTLDKQARSRRVEEDSRCRRADSTHRALDTHSPGTNVVASQPPRWWTLAERRRRLLLTLANGHPRSKGTGVQVTLVAGARNHLDLQLSELLAAVIET